MAIESSTRNPAISLQGILLPAKGIDYGYRTEAITAFQKGRTFEHHLLGKVQRVSIWDYAVGDMVKFRYDEHTKMAFYRVTKSDFIGV